MPKIQQDVTLNASPERVYRALIDASEHAAFTGQAAQIVPEAGGAAEWFEGKISGRTIELVPNTRIVQAWRAANWPEGTYSIVRYDLAEADGKTQLTLTHDAIPDGQEGHLTGGWDKMYWNPLAEYLA